MATLIKYVYKCPEHGEMDVYMERKNVGKDVPMCTYIHCGKWMKQVYTTYSLVVK